MVKEWYCLNTYSFVDAYSFACSAEIQVSNIMDGKKNHKPNSNPDHSSWLGSYKAFQNYTHSLT